MKQHTLKRFVTALFILAAGLVFADAAFPPPPTATVPGQTTHRRKRKRLTPEQQMERFGGFVCKAYSGRYCALMNAQTRVADTNFTAFAQQITQVLSLPMAPETTAPATTDNFAPIRTAWSGARKTGAVLSVIDIAGWPTLLIAPEDGWAQVNVAALAKDNPAPEALAGRVRKELWRALVYLFGGGNSVMATGDLMRPVNSLEDLDGRLAYAPGPEPFNAVLDGARARGITSIRRTTYKQACIEGWAPAPTNSFQKIIYEDVASGKERGPANAIKIAPPAATNAAAKPVAK